MLFRMISISGAQQPWSIAAVEFAAVDPCSYIACSRGALGSGTLQPLSSAEHSAVDSSS